MEKHFGEYLIDEIDSKLTNLEEISNNVNNIKNNIKNKENIYENIDNLEKEIKASFMIIRFLQDQIRLYNKIK